MTKNSRKTCRTQTECGRSPKYLPPVQRRSQHIALVHARLSFVDSDRSGVDQLGHPTCPTRNSATLFICPYCRKTGPIIAPVLTTVNTCGYAFRRINGGRVNSFFSEVASIDEPSETATREPKTEDLTTEFGHLSLGCWPG
jgi:hypothetical protein